MTGHDQTYHIGVKHLVFTHPTCSQVRLVAVPLSFVSSCSVPRRALECFVQNASSNSVTFQIHFKYISYVSYHTYMIYNNIYRHKSYIVHTFMYCQIIIDINFAQTCQTLGRTRTSSPARPRTFCSTRGMCPSKISCWAWNPGDQNLNTRDRYQIYIYILVRVWINIGADSLHFVWFNQLCDTFTIVCWPLSMGKASISSSSLPMFWHCSDRQLGRYLGSSRLSVKLQFVAVAD